ncbi:MAG: cyclic nucleotide-binding domain-containing protein [Acidimicrobiales bacterium]
MATKTRLAEALGSVHLFERCTKRDRRAIARHLEVVTVTAGTTVVAEGEHGETFYLVLSGELTVEQGGKATATLGPDDHFGELALLDPAPRSATVTATTDAELGALSVRMFRVLIREMPQIAGALLASLAGQLRQARKTV